MIVIKTFIINLRNLTKNKLFICKEYHIQPSEIDRMQFWEYEWYTDEIKEITKEQEKQQKNIGVVNFLLVEQKKNIQLVLIQL